MNKARAIASLIMILLLSGCKGGTEPQGDPDTTANWNVVATAPGETQAEAIEMIQAVMKLDAEGAKEFVATLPQVIASGVSEKEAEVVAARLRGAGMTVEVTRSEK